MKNFKKLNRLLLVLGISFLVYLISCRKDDNTHLQSCSSATVKVENTKYDCTNFTIQSNKKKDKSLDQNPSINSLIVNLSDGAFELDWNEIFVARLVKAGYHGKDDKAIVEQWFNNICSNVVAGTYEQEMADPEKRRRVQRKRIDKSTTEVS